MEIRLSKKIDLKYPSMLKLQRAEKYNSYRLVLNLLPLLQLKKILENSLMVNIFLVAQHNISISSLLLLLLLHLAF